MPKKFIKKHMPHPDEIKNHKSLQIFGQLLHNPFLWHFNRHSISGAFAVGIFCAFIPVPFQMVLAAAGAIIFHVNLPLSVALVWISNPLTMPPLFYGAYKIGAFILGTADNEFNFELSWDWLINGMSNIWQPFLLGCFIVGAVSALLSYITIQLLWRYKIMRDWQHRKKSRN